MSDAGSTDHPENSPRLFRAIFYGVWFLVVPAVLAVLTVKLLRAPTDLVAVDLPGVLRTFVRDQQVPAGIIFFTLFEMLFASLRHELPLSDKLSVVGRHGLPKEVREDFESAGQLLGETERILASRSKAISRDVSANAREDLARALEGLRDSMKQEPFDAEGFHEAHDKAKIGRASCRERV